MQLSEQIDTLVDRLDTLDELESYTSQFVITGDIEFKLEYLDVFLETFGVCGSDHMGSNFLLIPYLGVVSIAFGGVA